MRDLGDQLFDLTLEHHTLRATLMGLRDDGALQDHSEEAEQGFLQRYQDIKAKRNGERRKRRTTASSRGSSGTWPRRSATPSSRGRSSSA